MGDGKHGIRFSSYTEVSVMYSSSFYSLTASARLMGEKIRMLNQNMIPMMILGGGGLKKRDGGKALSGKFPAQVPLCDDRLSGDQ